MLQKSADWLIYSLFRMSPDSKLGHMLDFFVYDSIKIFILLFSMIAVIGVLRTYLPQDKVKKWVTGKHLWGNFLASSFGAVTPFCSCSSIPMFFGFLRAGIPLGVTFSFLITSPIINEYLFVLMVGFFGWKISVLYVVSGLCIGTICGALLGRMNLERYIVSDMLPVQVIDDGSGVCLEQVCLFPTIISRIKFGVGESVSIIKRLWLWILVGVGIGAVIHNFVPKEAIQAILNKTGLFSVPLAVLIGVPMYGSCASIVPIAVALFRKGLPLGTALAFMMAVSALSLPEAVMLKRAMKMRLIMIFFGITTAGIIFTGYLFNFLQAKLLPGVN